MLCRCKRVAFTNYHITNYHPLASTKDAWKTTRGFFFLGSNNQIIDYLDSKENFRILKA